MTVEMGLLRFGDQWPGEIVPLADVDSRNVRRKTRRIARKARRITREWNRKHGGINAETALHFAFIHLTNLHPGRRGEGRYDFISFGLGGKAPRGLTLSRWCTAYTILDPKTA